MKTVPRIAPVMAPAEFAFLVKNPRRNNPPKTPMNKPMILMNVSNKDLISGFTNTSPSRVPKVPIIKKL